MGLLQSSRDRQIGRGPPKAYQLRVLFSRKDRSPARSEDPSFPEKAALLSTPIFSFQRVEREIELQHINTGFAEEAKHAALGILCNQLAYLVF